MQNQDIENAILFLILLKKVLNMLDELYDLAVKLFESDFTQLMQEMHLLRMTDEEYEDERILENVYFKIRREW